MKIFNSLDNLPRFRRSVVTVGSFDGLHHGHRVLLERVREIARQRGGESVVVTFSPHPRQVLARGGSVKLLNTMPEKIYLLEAIGIDNLIVVPFDDAFAGTTYSDFVRALVDKAGMRSLVIGYDHHLGHDQQGSYSSLRELGEQLGFDLEQIPRQMAGRHGEYKVSSTELRNAIMAGDISLATELMSRGYIIVADMEGCGAATIHDELKLVPPAGRYGVIVNGAAGIYRDILAIDGNGVMRIENWQGRGAEKDVVMEVLNSAK